MYRITLPMPNKLLIMKNIYMVTPTFNIDNPEGLDLNVFPSSKGLFFFFE